ncbi:Holliday junction branch migration protein RuvA [Patescibacteria group bacterium]|nr:Holliday junction branch migration protein RuvA [Patescibacteria group bacterium]MBU1613086.1 Holliday junction branch migration protein RuvA [Patescibacteria group bacterium]
MISILRGKIVADNGAKIVIMTPGGVGYELAVKEGLTRIWKSGQETEVFTYLAVRENAMDLYGFANEEEREFFLKLLDVSGVGPKTALHILSLGSVEEISSAIAKGDVEYLNKVSGIGKKTAERLVVELKDKVTNLLPVHPEQSEGSHAVADAIDALVAMGYSALQARDAVKMLDATGKTSDQLLREALRVVR